MTHHHARRPSPAPAVPLAMALATALAGASALADAPPHVEALRQELRVAEDVFEAALDNVPDLWVSGVEADYLAGQGVLISLSVRTGWSVHGKRVVRIIRDEDVTVPVPEMVHEILADLELDLPSFGRRPPDLEPLRELRQEQRALRDQQRKVRERIWQVRLDMASGAREGDGAETVAALEEEMRRLEAEEAALETRIDAEYDGLTPVREIEDATEVEAPGATGETIAPNFPTTLARLVCDYGATLKSLPHDEHLSLRVRRRTGNTFHVYKFEDVIDCQRGAMTPEELLGKGVTYEG